MNVWCPFILEANDLKPCESHVLSKGLHNHILKLLFIFLIH